jgi:hypothetical protein
MLLQLVMQHFDRVVDDNSREGEGRLTPAAIRAFLLEMGIEPSDFEVSSTFCCSSTPLILERPSWMAQSGILI